MKGNQEMIFNRNHIHSVIHKKMVKDGQEMKDNLQSEIIDMLSSLEDQCFETMKKAGLGQVKEKCGKLQ